MKVPVPIWLILVSVSAPSSIHLLSNNGNTGNGMRPSRYRALREQNPPQSSVIHRARHFGKCVQCSSR